MTIDVLKTGRDQHPDGRPLKAGVPLVRALERGLALLRSFSPAEPQLTLSDLAKATDLDIGTTRRLLQTLEVSGFVVLDKKAGKYALSNLICELAIAAGSSGDLREVARPYLEELAGSGATAFLWTHTDGQAICLDRIRAQLPDVDATWFAVGAKTAMNAGGGPRVMLAHLPPAEFELALSQPMVQRTPMSVVDVTELRATAKAIRERGWVLACDDFVVGLAGLGVPIHSRSGHLLGALAVSTITNKFGNPEDPFYLSELRKAAAVIGSKLSN